MVCSRCILVVKEILTSEGIEPLSVTLGDVRLKTPADAAQLERLNERLVAVGFEILTDQKKKLVDNIKNFIIRQIQDENLDDGRNFSEKLSAALHKDYSYLSKLFSEVQGVTIERYIIDQRIEKAKELLAYGEFNLSEISYRLGYSSVAHLSSQFKKTTGFSPSEFRKLKDHHRRSLDDV